MSQLIKAIGIKFSLSVAVMCRNMRLNFVRTSSTSGADRQGYDPVIKVNRECSVD